jgi:TolB protein
MKGDFILHARGRLLGKGVDPHRKMGWMIRAGADTNAAMVSAAVHGDGLTSLQYREAKGDSVKETPFQITAPDVIQLERKGNTYIMSVARHGDPFVSEKITDINLGDNVYIGLFICSHNADTIEKASFENVRIIVPAKDDFVPYRDYIGSTLETMVVQTGTRRQVYFSTASIQAPNYTLDGQSLIYNRNGLIYKFNLAKGKTELVKTGTVKENNNDHVISFDGKMLGLSANSLDGKFRSVVYTVPVVGGSPKQITPIGPSYLHGWSPDGKYLLYTAERDNDNYDIYRIPATGGEETRLTDAKGLDDGSEYSPDGKYIYFNSVRSGTMQIWRMNADGSEQEQVTDDEYNNWFPHVSPDGKWIVMLSYMSDVEPDQHPFYKHVYLRLIPVSGGKPKVIAYLYGGQGSINTASWSPDSKRIAFVSNSQ